MLRIVKWYRNKQRQKQEQIELLQSIASSLREIERSLDKNSRYGNAIRTTTATRY